MTGSLTKNTLMYDKSLPHALMHYSMGMLTDLALPQSRKVWLGAVGMLRDALFSGNAQGPDPASVLGGVAW